MPGGDLAARRPSQIGSGSETIGTLCIADLIICSTDFGALFDRFNSLFDRLGNLPMVLTKTNGLTAAIGAEKAAKTDFCQYLPLHREILGGSFVLCSGRRIQLR
jgi:hypothetical protein